MRHFLLQSCVAHAGISVTVLLASLSFSPTAGATTVLVDPSNMGDWTFYNADGTGAVGANPTGVGGMVTGPETPPLGIGSAQLATGNGMTGGDGAELIANSAYSGTLLSNITALSYSTYDTLNNGQQFPYLRLEITNGSGQFDSLFFEPPYQTPSAGGAAVTNDQGPTSQNKWQTWDAFNGVWWDNNGACGSGGFNEVSSFATCIGKFAGWSIVNDYGTAGVMDGVGGVNLDVGFASSTDQFNGYVDNFTIGVSGTDTTFNFDPNPVPEPASLSMFGVALIGLWGFTWVRRRRPS